MKEDGSRGEVRMGVDILGLLDDDSCIYSSFSLRILTRCPELPSSELETSCACDFRVFRDGY